MVFVVCVHVVGRCGLLLCMCFVSGVVDSCVCGCSDVCVSFCCLCSLLYLIVDVVFACVVVDSLLPVVACLFVFVVVVGVVVVVCDCCRFVFDVIVCVVCVVVSFVLGVVCV